MATKRYDRLLNRRALASRRLFENYSESYEHQVGENTRYLIGAMAPVDPASTAKLIEQGDRVQSQLSNRLYPNYSGLAFRRQGSVSNYTHIRYFSDVDLLTIIDKYSTLEMPQPNPNPYKGNPEDDLLVLRKECVGHLSSAFPGAKVDDTGSTAVAISGASLSCPVDVVPANWYETLAYAAGQGEHMRGVQVLNKDDMKRSANFPFLFNYRVDTQDKQYAGVPRALIRLLKSVKADYDEDHPSAKAGISSFDLCSIIYRMPVSYFATPINQPLEIVRQLLLWLQILINQVSVRSALKVIDDSRFIFDELTKVTGITILYAELLEVYKGALPEQNNRLLLSEAHVGH